MLLKKKTEISFRSFRSRNNSSWNNKKIFLKFKQFFFEIKMNKTIEFSLETIQLATLKNVNIS